MPRMELNGAVVLAKLLVAASADLHIETDCIFAWTDSSIVLGWMHIPPAKLEIYVANRIKAISQLVPLENWRYVNTSFNPADHLTRGVQPSQLKELTIWWEGPPWLKLSPSEWPRRADINRDRELPVLKALQVKATPAPHFADKFSKFTTLQRITAWMLRFIDHCRKKKHSSAFLSTQELIRAKDCLLQLSQRESYPDVVELLSKGKPLPLKHQLISLQPILKDGMLRVKGRAGQANFSQSRLHPVILSPTSHITKLLVHQAHLQALHAEPSTVLAILSAAYYIPRVRSLVRGIC